MKFKECICVCYCYLNSIRYSKYVKYEYYIDNDGDYGVRKNGKINYISCISFNVNFMDLRIYRDKKISELI